MNEQDPDVKGLLGFANRTDREASPIVVGRERETKHVLRRAELVGEVYAEGRNTQGATIVVTGCPGSGKSAFLEHLARTCAMLDLTKTAIIPIPCSDLELTARNSKELRAQLARLAVRRAGGLHETFQALLEDAGQAPGRGSTLERLERTISEKTGKRTVVCLLVDDIHNVTEANAAAVELLHTGAFSPPVLPVFAGREDSADKLDVVCGIVRLAANAGMTMGTLPEHTAAEATAQLFEKYRVRDDAGARAAWAQAIDAEALGFAQHLHGGLQGACAVLAARGGIARAEDAAEVKRRARDARERFYAAKMSGMVDDHARAVLDVVHRAVRTNTWLTRLHLAAWAKASMQKHRPLSAGYSSEAALALVEHMRRQGILHLTAEDRAEVPIPSLHAWLTGPYARHIAWQPPPHPPGRNEPRPR